MTGPCSEAESGRRRRFRRRRGVALLLVLLVVTLCSAVAYSFIASQGTSIAIARNVRDHAKARYVAETGFALTLEYVRDHSDWRTAKSEGTWVSDQAYGDGTFTVAVRDGEDTDGDGVISIPTEGDGDLGDDAGDAATITVTATDAGNTHVLRAVLTAIPGNTNAMVVYGYKDNAQPYCRTWQGDSWSSSQLAGDIGATEPKWILNGYCPTRTEVAVCTLDNAEDVNLQFYDGSSWSTVTELTSATVQNSERCIGMAYEQLSGDLLIAYRSSGSTELRFRTYNGVALSNESSLTLPYDSGLKWVRLTPKPGSDEILLVTLDANKDVNAAIWNGVTWTDAIGLETNAKAAGDEGITAAYEGLSGHAVVAWTETNLYAFQYRVWDGAAWSAEAATPLMGTNEPRWVHMASDPSSDEIILGSLNGSNEVNFVVWDGDVWGAPLLVENQTPDADKRSFDVAYENGGGEALAVWGRGGEDNFFYRTWDGAAWSAEQAGPGLNDRLKFAQLVTGLAPGQIFVTLLDASTAGTLNSFLWTGGALNDLGILDSSIAGSNAQEAFMVGTGTGTGTGTYTYEPRWVAFQ